SVENIVSLGAEGGEIIFVSGIESANNFLGKTFSLPREFSENFDKGVANKISNIKYQISKLTEDISSYTELSLPKVEKKEFSLIIKAKVKMRTSFSSLTYIVGTVGSAGDEIINAVGEIVSTIGSAGDVIVNNASGIVSSAIVSSADNIQNTISSGGSQLADIGKINIETSIEILAGYGDWLARQPSVIARNYSSANDFVEKELVSFEGKILDAGRDAGRLGLVMIQEVSDITAERYNGANQLLKKELSSLNSLAEKKLSSLDKEIVQLSRGVQNILQNGYRAITSPFVKTYQFVSGPWRIVSPEKTAVQDKETKEKLEQLQEEIQNIKEGGVVAREIIKEVSRIIQVEPIKEITKETFKQTIITKVGPEALFDIESQLSLQTGNIAQQALQISNLQLEMNRRPTGFISSPSSVQPVSQQANLTKLYAENGQVTLQTSGSGNIVISSAGTVTISGTSISLGGSVSLGSAQTITGSSDTLTMLTVTQNGLGNIIDFKDGDNVVFSIADGGYATLAVDASTTPSFIIKALGTSWTPASSTYLGINATTSFDGRFLDFTTDGSSVFYIDSLGNVVGGSVSYATTTIVGDLIVDTSTLYVDSTNHRVGIGTTSPSNLFSIATSTDIFNVTNYGYVGIGTSTPSATFNAYSADTVTAFLFEQDGTGSILDIQNATGSVLTIDNAGNLTSGSYFYVDQANQAVAVGTTTASGVFTVGTTTDPMMNITTEGYVAFGTTSPLGIFTIGTSSDSIFNITTEGNVGIGTTGPNNLLQVAGLVNFNNTLFSTSLGYQAGNVNAGDYNSFIGYQAGLSNTTGYNNSVMGVSALSSNTTGYYNAAMGGNALLSNTTGYQNSAMGVNALSSNTTGNYNSAVGVSAGNYQADGATALTTANNSVYIGYNAMGFNDSDSNSIVIGASAKGIGANTVVLGNDSIVTTALKGNVGIGTTTPSAVLDVVASSTAYGLSVIQQMTGGIADFQNATGSVFAIDNTGHITMTGNLTATGNIVGANISVASTSAWDIAEGIVTASSTGWEQEINNRIASSTDYVPWASASTSAWDIASGWASGYDMPWIISGTSLYASSTYTGIGIGTTTPSAILHAYTSATTTAILEQVGPTDEILIAKNATGTVLTIDNAGNLTSGSYFYVDQANQAVAVGTTTSSGIFNVGTSSASILTISTEGNVGIGRTNPGTKLEVTGLISSTFGGLQASYANANLRLDDTAGYPYDIQSTAGRLKFIHVGISTPVGYLSATGLYVGNQLTRYISDDGTNITLNGQISTSGNVGIGTTTPIAALHVYTSSATTTILEQVGTEYILEAKNATGTVLTIDNAGNLTSGSYFYVDQANQAVAVGTTTASGVFTIGTTTESFFNINTEGNLAIGTTTASGIFNIGTSSDSIFTVTTEGYVGIGTTSPAKNLHLKTTSGSSAEMLLDSPSNTQAAYYVGADGALKGAFYRPSNSNDARIWVGQDVMTFQVTSGNVGIGTTTPSAILHAYTSATTTAILEQVGPTDEILLAKNATGTVLTIDNAGNLTSGSYFYVDQANGGVAVGTTTASGVFTIGTTTESFFNINTEGSLAIGTTTASGIFNIGTSSASIFNITTEGNVGIGTSSAPAYPLDVYGSVNIPSQFALASAAYRLNVNDVLSQAGVGYNTDDIVINRAGLSVVIKGSTITMGTSSNFYISSEGNVGIGTTTPSAILHAYTSATTTAILEQAGPTDEILLAKNATGTVLTIDNTGHITMTGNLTATGNIVGANISVASSSAWDIAEGIVTASSTGWEQEINNRIASSTDYVPWASASTSAWDIAAGLATGYDMPWIISGTSLYASSTYTGIGIGTTTPSAILHVYTSATTTAILEQVGPTDEILLAKNATGTVLTIDNAGNLTSGSYFYVDQANGAVAVGTTTASGVFTIGTTTESFFNINTEGSLAIGTTTASGIFNIGTSSASILSVTTEGNVGIGTTGPLGALDIRSNGQTARFTIQTVGGGTPDAYPLIYMGGTSGSVAGIFERVTSGASFYFGETTNTGGVVFRGSGNITIEGNVGIGTTTPSALLHAYTSATTTAILEQVGPTDEILIAKNAT
ncbi:MAG: hypothetical protein Q7S82_00165, partial [bacterium]|nr:hypothetical protein [bacterium]